MQISGTSAVVRRCAGTILAILVLAPPLARAAEAPAPKKAAPAVAAPACAPPCREGFTCLQGKCVSACNPPCAANERCTSDRRCLKTEPAAKPAPIAPPPAAPAPAPAPEAAPAAAPADPVTYELGAALGVLFPGTIDTDVASLDTSTGLLLRLSGDFHVAPRLGVGAYLLYASTTVGDSDGSVVGLGVTAKGYFTVSPKLVFRPGIAIGYQLSQVQSGSDSATGLGVAALAELAMPFAKGTNGFVQLSFLSQPSGGISGVTDVTWAPIFYLAVGVELAR